MIYIFIKKQKIALSELFNSVKKQIADLFDVSSDNLIFEKNKIGKPYVKDNLLYISGAHSGEYTVLAVGKFPLGADIEKEKDIDYYMLAKRLFPNHTINSQKELFRHWAGYEAVYKRFGQVNLSQFDKELDSITYFNYIDGYTFAISSIEKEFAFVVV